nr:hypothetical protein [Tanacetum cinerariifolium]
MRVVTIEMKGLGPVWGCDRLVFRAKVIENQVPVAPEVGATIVASPVGVSELEPHSSSKADPSESSPPPVSVAPMVSPFLCSDDSESDTEIPERHVSPTPHDAMLTRWRRRVALRSSSPTTSTLEIHTAPILCAPSAIVAPSSELPLAPVVAPPGILPSRANLLPPRKRFRDSISPEDSVEEDIDTNVLEDIEVDATAVEVAVDRDVEARVDTKVGVDVVGGIDIPDGMLIPNAVECLEQVEEEREARSLITGRERASLLENLTSLERSNVRLRGTMMMERARADRFRRRARFLESELRQIRRFCYYDEMRFRRLETFAVRRLGFRP